jgi:hypothetical protein
MEANHSTCALKNHTEIAWRPSAFYTRVWVSWRDLVINTKYSIKYFVSISSPKPFQNMCTCVQNVYTSFGIVCSASQKDISHTGQQICHSEPIFAARKDLLLSSIFLISCFKSIGKVQIIILTFTLTQILVESIIIGQSTIIINLLLILYVSCPKS